jgi:Tfp pilus assembly protein PilN
MAQEINLLENRLHDTTNIWQKQNKLMLTILVVILVGLLGLGLVFVFLNRSVAQKIGQVEADNKAIQAQIDSQQITLIDAKTFQAQLINLHALVDQHFYWSSLLDELSKMTHQKAQYVTLDAGVDGSMHIEGRVDKYSDLGKLLLGLSTSKEFTKIKLLTTTPSTGANSGFLFSLNLTASPNLFLKK